MKFTIFKRLVLGYLTIMVMVIFMGYYVNIKLKQLNKINHDMASVDLVTFSEIEYMKDILVSQTGFEKKYLVLHDIVFYEQFNKARMEFEKTIAQVIKLSKLPGEKDLLSDVEKEYDLYVKSFENEVLLLKKGEEYPGDKYLEERNKIADSVDSALKKIILIERNERNRKMELSEKLSYRVLRNSTLTAFLVIVAGLVISVVSTRSINHSLKLLKAKTHDLAGGKFEKIDDIVSPPEIKELADDFNRMSGKLKELDEMKMDFISHVSHELRTPLTAIREASGMLLDEKFKKSPEQQQELLVITHEECERLIDAVNKILDLSKIESGMMEYRFERDSIVSLVQKIVLKLAPIAQSKGIDLMLNPVKNVPDIPMDREMIGNVLENLVGNALKYTQENGEVSINISHTSNEDENILVSITDNGPGIAKNEQETIFEKFRRSEAVNGIVKGTGLGLSIARHIITEHRGKIWVESEPGIGSIFSFTLPVQ